MLLQKWHVMCLTFFYCQFQHYFRSFYIMLSVLHNQTWNIWKITRICMWDFIVQSVQNLFFSIGIRLLHYCNISYVMCLVEQKSFYHNMYSWGWNTSTLCFIVKNFMWGKKNMFFFFCFFLGNQNNLSLKCRTQFYKVLHVDLLLNKSIAFSS